MSNRKVWSCEKCSEQNYFDSSEYKSNDTFVSKCSKCSSHNIIPLDNAKNPMNPSIVKVDKSISYTPPKQIIEEANLKPGIHNVTYNGSTYAVEVTQKDGIKRLTLINGPRIYARNAYFDDGVKLERYSSKQFKTELKDKSRKFKGSEDKNKEIIQIQKKFEKLYNTKLAEVESLESKLNDEFNSEINSLNKAYEQKIQPLNKDITLIRSNELNNLIGKELNVLNDSLMQTEEYIKQLKSDKGEFENLLNKFKYIDEVFDYSNTNNYSLADDFFNQLIDAVINEGAVKSLNNDSELVKANYKDRIEPELYKRIINIAEVIFRQRIKTEGVNNAKVSSKHDYDTERMLFLNKLKPDEVINTLTELAQRLSVKYCVTTQEITEKINELSADASISFHILKRRIDSLNTDNGLEDFIKERPNKSLDPVATKFMNKVSEKKKLEKELNERMVELNSINEIKVKNLSAAGKSELDEILKNGEKELLSLKSQTSDNIHSLKKKLELMLDTNKDKYDSLINKVNEDLLKLEGKHLNFEEAKNAMDDISILRKNIEPYFKKFEESGMNNGMDFTSAFKTSFKLHRIIDIDKYLDMMRGGYTSAQTNSAFRNDEILPLMNLLKKYDIKDFQNDNLKKELESSRAEKERLQGVIDSGYYDDEALKISNQIEELSLQLIKPKFKNHKGIIGYEILEDKNNDCVYVFINNESPDERLINQLSSNLEKLLVNYSREHLDKGADKKNVKIKFMGLKKSESDEIELRVNGRLRFSCDLYTELTDKMFESIDSGDSFIEFKNKNYDLITALHISDVNDYYDYVKKQQSPSKKKGAREVIKSGVYELGKFYNTKLAKNQRLISLCLNILSTAGPAGLIAGVIGHAINYLSIASSFAASSIELSEMLDYNSELRTQADAYTQSYNDNITLRDDLNSQAGALNEQASLLDADYLAELNNGNVSDVYDFIRLEEVDATRYFTDPTYEHYYQNESSPYYYAGEGGTDIWDPEQEQGIENILDHHEALSLYSQAGSLESQADAAKVAAEAANTNAQTTYNSMHSQDELSDLEESIRAQERQMGLNITLIIALAAGATALGLYGAYRYIKSKQNNCDYGPIKAPGYEPELPLINYFETVKYSFEAHDKIIVRN